MDRSRAHAQSVFARVMGPGGSVCVYISFPCMHQLHVCACAFCFDLVHFGVCLYVVCMCAHQVFCAMHLKTQVSPRARQYTHHDYAIAFMRASACVRHIAVFTLLSRY
eukprot:GDKI01010578.1.p2 GENE.GDKI01010578.1~~GDKI01010578.1.p2  ORF type:complete len:108 (-),score=20.47 GDKI01010578.1:101-424(-)